MHIILHTTKLNSVNYAPKYAYAKCTLISKLHTCTVHIILQTTQLHNVHHAPNYILYLYEDETRNILSNIALRLREFPRAKPEGTPKGGGLYLTVYPELSPNTGSI